MAYPTFFAKRLWQIRRTRIGKRKLAWVLGVVAGEKQPPAEGRRCKASNNRPCTFTQRGPAPSAQDTHRGARAESEQANPEDELHGNQPQHKAHAAIDQALQQLV